VLAVGPKIIITIFVIVHNYASIVNRWIVHLKLHQPDLVHVVQYLLDILQDNVNSF